MPLVAYDIAGKVVATLDHVVARNDAGDVIGLVDFEAYELSGGPLTDIWQVSGAAGSGTWPEWLGIRFHEFSVVLDPSTKRITQLVHISGFRRVRAAIEATIAAVQPDANGVRDIRAIVGGPTRPLTLNPRGQTVAAAAAAGTPAHLPILGR